ncbi:phosphotransacetylase family protein [Cyanobium sp. Aljojuca 7D2]|jgi:BioD-like phosphotransacetylase family protein|uniref:phosphotransacetylase family protein n=1 Tax=Cyanobium sp. Aljojuca 7D2 TaxID=2823698 RepID=UPI0020CEB31C|nr:phosphotransacetylase family protein [Cyanobium sp. Aljojuca 7D2]MCP9890677.1 phosphotransacetylase family protein [Cyanobium sp. Aljojuca 7D2]
MAPTLLIGSCEAFSGKSAVVLGLARQLSRQGIPVRFGKPLATSLDEASTEWGQSPLLDADVRFIGATLGLPEAHLIPSLHVLDGATAQQRLVQGDLEPGPGFALLRQQLAEAPDGLTLLEAAGSLHEGLLYGLSLPQLAEGLEATVVLVHPWLDSRSIDPLLAAQAQLGERLAGVVLNAVKPELVPQLRAELIPALAQLGLPVLGVMPQSPLLRSVTVEELALRLGAQVLCCPERLDLLVETLSIGAMNVNSAMEFFRRRRNMAVVTGADRTDIQLAALEASTQCLILTGAGEPLPQLLNRAEELDVPLLKVEHDTLTTVEVIEQAFGHVRLHEAVKASFAFRLVEEHCNFEPLFRRLKLPAMAK